MSYCVHSGVAACSTCVSLDLTRQQLDRVASEGLKAANDLTAARTRVAELEGREAGFQRTIDALYRDLGALRERLGEAVKLLSRESRMHHGDTWHVECTCDVHRFLARLDASPQAAPPGDMWPPPYHAQLCTGDDCTECARLAATPVQGCANHTDCEAADRASGGGATHADPAPIQGAPPAEFDFEPHEAIDCKGHHTGECISGVSAPADGPTCAAWCGTEGMPGVFQCPAWHAPTDRNDYCSKPCADAGRPLHPAPAVPEPVRELSLGLALPHAAKPLPAEEKKT